MMYRLFAIGVLLLWAATMTALVMRDVWPAWTAQDAPPMTAQQFARLDQQAQQFGIFNAANQRIGSAWSEVSSPGETTVINGTVLVDGLTTIPPIRIESRTDFDADGGLDAFQLNLYGVPMMQIWVRGERRGIYFPCEMHFGPIHREASLDLAASRLIGETFRPFTFLPTLTVGQSWRMQLLDPMSIALRGQADFTSVIATVTGIETIEHPIDPSRTVECFVVQTSPNPTTAWVDPQGQVLVQQVDMPGVGQVTVRREPFQKADRESARKRVRNQ